MMVQCSKNMITFAGENKTETMRKTIFFAIATALLVAACGQRHEAKSNDTTISIQKNMPGDSAYYGLAADGSTDSLLVFLPYSGENLDTFDILQARQEHRLMGWLRTGDDVTVVAVNDTTDSTLAVKKIARLVVNISQLQGTWCYKVTPQWRREPPQGLPDSIRQRLMAPREYSIDLRTDGSVRPHGAGQRQEGDRMSPVKYPPLPRHRSWHLFNGRLVLAHDTTATTKSDTAEIIQLRRDTLVLRFKDHEQQYYRK